MVARTPARRLWKVVTGRQTRTDVGVSSALLTAAALCHLYSVQLAWGAYRQQLHCGSAVDCGAGERFDLVAILLCLSLVFGLTLGLRAVLKMLNRRNAWVYAAADVVVAGGFVLAVRWILGAA